MKFLDAIIAFMRCVLMSKISARHGIHFFFLSIFETPTVTFVSKFLMAFYSKGFVTTTKKNTILRKSNFMNQAKQCAFSNVNFHLHLHIDFIAYYICVFYLIYFQM